MNIDNEYLNKYKKEFEDTHHLMIVDNHQQHNTDPEYWAMLLGPIKFNPEHWKGKKAFDFGCGCGRNLKNLLDLAEWDSVYGCDISKQNADYAKQWTEGYYPGKVHTWESMGADIQPCEENSFDFIMSHIVMQHISNYSVRYSILTDMYKCLKPEGLVSLHYLDMTISSKYYEDSDAYQNCVVENPQYLIDDFKKIGFKDITCDTGTDPFTSQRTYYIKGYK
jgi:2-polyprenyl-3-methyl-5-hydroxy-6-metoxy-1,4-benzoquinol methylase